MQQVKEHLSLRVMKKSSLLLPQKLRRGKQLIQMVEHLKIVLSWIEAMAGDSWILNAMVEQIIQSVKFHLLLQVILEYDIITFLKRFGKTNLL